MAPPSATQNGGGGAGSGEEDAKDFLDKIGQQVHAQMKTEDTNYIGDLKGSLSQAPILGELASSPNPCNLESEYNKLLGDRGDPCGSASDKRFSVKEQAEYDNKKMKCSNDGACPPYRRLSLCNKSMEKMETTKITDKNDLLAEVCMAAKYEGESIKAHYKRYDAEYPSDSSHTTCTALARSFADIGDIIRGRDLYGGNKKKKRLEENLKTIFGKIYDKLDGKNGAEAKEHYKDGSGDFFQLREDWWTANRSTIWEAMTCDVDGSYFRATCSDSHRSETFSQAKDKCRCDGANVVPTYFDYVPQYLRWFEEWAEDFCRKKKKYVDIVKKYCRGKDKNSDEYRYCSRNGYDCEKTISRIGKVRMGKGCTDCFFACNPYEKWIDNQRKQFLKQKERYDNVINGTSRGSRRQRRGVGGTTTTNYEGYESKFYEKLKSEYSDVNAFLGLLNNEKACQAVNDDKGGKIDFKQVNSGSTNGGTSGASGTNDKNEGTFYRSKYCQPCPDCGVRHKVKGEFEDKDTTGIKCAGQILYKPKSEAKGTPIRILKSGDRHDDIEKKLKEFCDGKNDESLYDPWKCYKEDDIEKQGDDEEDYENVKKSGGLCILKKENKSSNEPKEIQKTFHNFFYYWVAHMLKDSIYWETQKLEKCLKNGTKTRCKNKIKCKTDCDCFETWIGQKKEQEWTKIKEQFRKQKITGHQGGMVNGAFLDGLLTPDFVLQEVLKLEFENKNTEEDKENNVSAREIHLINQMLKEDEKEQEEEDGADNEENTPIDKLLKHEKKIATKCQQKQNECEEQKTQPDGGGPGARKLDTQRDPKKEESEPEEDEDEGEAEEEEEEDEEDNTVENQEGETADGTEEDGQGPTVEEGVKPACDIVAELFSDTNKFKDVACNQKYAKNNSRLGWKCIPTSGESTKSGDTGGLCVPPRRRRLYIQKLHDWAEKYNKVGTTQVEGSSEQSVQSTRNGGTEGSSNGPSTSESSDKDPQVALLKAFVESAAIETFFLWHRYKKQKEKPQEGASPLGIGMEGPFSSVSQEEEPPDKQLQQGTIPEEFKRQMFYTLGDYRDICIGDEKVIEVLKASGDNNIETINKKIKTILNGDTSPPAPPGKTSVKDPQTWWDDNAKDIWKGMICALTYKENGSGGDGKTTTITQDTNLKEQLLENGKNTPKNPRYQYNTVKLDDTSGAKTVSPSGEKTTLNNPKLSDFVKIPPFFRWLHEWGSDFCGKRARMLKDVKDNCLKSDGSTKKCSGYGENCEEIFSKKYDILPDFNCPDCGKYCSSYRRWIERKKIEFTKQSGAYDEQKKAYNEQKQKYEEENKGGVNGFCGKLEENAAAFLQKLGSCSKNNNESGEDKLDFNEPDNTFKQAHNCRPCSQFKIDCQNDNCSKDKEQECKNKKITAANFDTMVKSTKEVVMRVSDNSGNGFQNGLKDCEGKSIFKGIRKEQWKCDNVCGYVVCKPENGNVGTDGNKYIQITALMRRWVHNFLDDYKKIKHKISHCTKNSEVPTCINGCVEQWITRKKEEWQQIKERFNDQYKNKDEDVYPVTSFLEGLIPQITDANDKKQIIKLSKFGNSCGCSAIASSQKKNGEYKDAIECMLNKLTEKIKTESYPTQTSGDTQAKCQDTHPDEDLLLEEEENPENMRPKICPAPQKEEVKEEDGCKPASPDEEKKDVKKEESAAEKPAADSPPVKPAPAPKAPPSPTLPLPSDEPSKPIGDILSSTIPFGIAIALTSIVFLFLKKKTKSSVGNLFQILQIPKSDYDIPTLKSKNRYIPYKSAQYKGKTYIYMEGDSSGDEKYAFMSDTTDVTSSESEYEELDINDIYVPGSPKYKTLIEVVLEPSGNNTTASGKNTPSDTQNDIQNDGIPSSDTPMNKFTDEEWNQLKQDFISQYVVREPLDVPNDYKSGDIPFNTQPNTLYFDNNQEKPFIMSIHDRNLFSGEENNYNVNMVDNNDDIPINRDNNVYSGIDLINDSLSGNKHIDIYDEVLKRKENELFGTEHHPKRTTTNHFATPTRDDPIHNQLELFHKWLDRHRDMCEQWNKNKKEELLDKLKEEWNKKNNNNSDLTHTSSNIPSGENSIKNVLNTDVSIQIDMDDPKPINEFTNMDNIIDNLEKNSGPYYDIDEDDIIYFDIDDEKTPMYHNNMDNNKSNVPTKVQIEMNVINKQELFQEEFPISDIWNI